MEPGAVRNLEQIQEDDDASRVPRRVTVVLVALGGACVVFGALALQGRRTAPAAKAVDPLGELVAAHDRAAGGRAAASASASAAAIALSTHDVTFPQILSDDARPTTALAAVRGAPPPPAASSAASASPASPPPADDRLTAPYPAVPVPGSSDGRVAVPAQTVLEATPVVTRPRDALTRAASESAQLTTAAAPLAPAGHDGAYQLQVSSFRDAAEAAQFVDQLRARGHRAYVLEAHVPGRGTWYRVRIGPFTSQQSAAAYRSSFEAREHLVPFVILPPPKAGTATGH